MNRCENWNLAEDIAMHRFIWLALLFAIPAHAETYEMRVARHTSTAFLQFNVM
jgi:hypothetical protein